MRDFLALPFAFVLNLFYSWTNSYLVSILILTLITRLVLLPASISQQKNSAKQVRLNTKVNKIKQKFAGNQQKIQEETQALYQREGFSAANMGCAPMLIQLGVMMGLYQVIYTPLSTVLHIASEKITQLSTDLASFITTTATKATSAAAARSNELKLLELLDPTGDNYAKIYEVFSKVLNPEELNSLVAFKKEFAVGIFDLAHTPDFKAFDYYWIIPIVAFATAMLSSVYMYMKQRKQNPEMAKNPTMGCMTFMSPVMSLVFTFALPCGIGFYWIISNVLSFIQQIILSNAYSPKKVIAQQMVDETVTRRSRENNVKKRVEMENNA
ncbi:MAG: membrane protein insertase YidC [Clostridia bacterium]|nr:membrane protein insertase YidC [Clostridia bacterium]